MSVPFGIHAFTVGEVSPSLFAREDLARYKVGASTARNGFIRYSGGFYSRAGTAFTGFSKQTGRNLPPRLIPFQFNLNQGLGLEFGNFYMRIVSNGGYVTEGPLDVLGITQADPAVLTTAAQGVQSATSNPTGATSTYAPGDLVTLAGGVAAVPAVLRVTNTQLLSTTVLTPGVGNYAPADTIHVNGGVQTVSAILTVATTKVVSATVAAGGSGGTDGTQEVTGTTGTGTPFQAFVTVSGGVITTVVSISVPGSYSVNPTVPGAEPVTGAGLTGAELDVVLGVNTVTVTTPGTFTINPVNGVLVQSTTSGSGTGATFNMSVLGPNAVSVANAGSYAALPANPVMQASTTGIGAGATFTCVFFNTQPYQVGDWLAVAGVGGMTEVNGQVFVVSAATANTVTLADVYGDPIDSTTFGAYTGGGTVSRIYTVVAPYSEQDLKWLKFTQSADDMSIACINQDTSTSYQPYDLRRLGNTNWTFTPVAPGPAIATPTGVSASASAGGGSTYAFIVTAVAPDGSESLGSTPAGLPNVVDIFATAGTLTVSWGAVSGAVSYNVYQAAISFNGLVPAGTPYGIVATGVTGTSWQNSNIEPDFTTVPPTFQNPFPGPAEYPSTVWYFQQRRGYGNSLSQPDIYNYSQPGSFTNFNTRTPPISSDAITGAPWVTQVDGIQFVVDMPGGAVVLTGREAWQLTGTGGSSFNPQPITPTTQQAQPQAFNGCNNHVPPIRIDYDILYVQAKGSIVRDLNYNFYSNIYTGTDITLNSSHLFNFFQIQEWCWAEEPYKLVWAVRTDGALLSCTFLKPEQIQAWTRHDTQGSFVSICSIVEPPVDAVYVACSRVIGNHQAYTIERMDNRLWTSVDEAWCVDCGQALPQPQPDADLLISSADGSGVIVNPVPVTGGNGYSAATQVVVIDDNGQGLGAGAVVTPVIVGGVITALAGGGGTNYTSPRFYAVDPAGSEGGSGFTGTCTLQNTVTLDATGAVFNPGVVGSVVRAAGGIAQITNYNSPTEVTADVWVPFANVIPQDNNEVSATPPDSYTPVDQGNWTMTAPVSKVTGLNYLAGARVMGVADGQKFGPLTVSSAGTIDLPSPASNVVVGLSFLPQLQSLYLDTGSNPTNMGQRKAPKAVTLRVESSRAFQAGSNQVDGSTLNPPQIGPTWRNLGVVPDVAQAPFGSSYVPLGTGDVRVPLIGGFTTRAQVAVQQPDPFPMNILGFAIEDDPGDPPQLHAPKSAQRGNVQSEAA